MRLISTIFILYAAGTFGCKAPVGVKNTTLEPDSATQCAKLCTQIGLELGAVAIIADNVGCVCRVAAPAAEGASV